MSERAHDCPPEILAWIAWYPDGGLSAAQRSAVEAHAAVCAACRDELAVLAGRAESPVAPADPERLFARVLALVEAEALGGTPAATPVTALASDAVVLDVGFRPDATVAEIHTALRVLGARVVAGPSPLGRFRVALPPDADARAATALLQAGGTGVAAFVEPVAN